MIPVFQTKFKEPDGNCLAACLASLLEVDLRELEEFADVYAEHCASDEEYVGYVRKPPPWWRSLQQTLQPHNFQPSWLPDSSLPPIGWAITWGYSELGAQHAVVVNDGQMIHDPHPQGIELEDVEGYLVLVPCLRTEEPELLCEPVATDTTTDQRE